MNPYHQRLTWPATILLSIVLLSGQMAAGRLL
jgi:hypothetical protein